MFYRLLYTLLLVICLTLPSTSLKFNDMYIYAHTHMGVHTCAHAHTHTQKEMGEKRILIPTDKCF